MTVGTGHAVERGFVRPSLLYQSEHRVVGKDEIPKEVLTADQPFAEYCRSVHYAIVEGFCDVAPRVQIDKSAAGR